MCGRLLVRWNCVFYHTPYQVAITNRAGFPAEIKKVTRKYIVPAGCVISLAKPGTWRWEARAKSFDGAVVSRNPSENIKYLPSVSPVSFWRHCGPRSSEPPSPSADLSLPAAFRHRYRPVLDPEGRPGRISPPLPRDLHMSQKLTRWICPRQWTHSGEASLHSLFRVSRRL